METRKLEDLLRQAVKELEEIRLILEGNTKLGIEGLLKKVNRHDTWITKMNLRMAAWSGAGAVIVIATKGLWSLYFSK